MNGDISTAAAATVTLFGDNGTIDRALSHELARRGSRTHAVSVMTGWLSSATHAVVRLDTAAGAVALTQLSVSDESPTHVIAMCARPLTERDSRRLQDLCRQCSATHDVCLIWHPPVDGDPDETAWSGDTPVGELAAMVADELAGHGATQGPAFEARTFEPARTYAAHV